MPDETNPTLSKILSLLIEEMESEKKIASLEALRNEGTEEWPTLEDLEGAYVGRVLRHTQGNKQAAARLLKIDRKTLDRMIKRHNLMPADMQTRTASP